MSDLIDRQKAIEAITCCTARPDALAAVWKPESVAAYNGGIQNAINAINTLPPEDIISKIREMLHGKSALNEEKEKVCDELAKAILAGDGTTDNVNHLNEEGTGHE